MWAQARRCGLKETQKSFWSMDPLMISSCGRTNASSPPYNGGTLIPDMPNLKYFMPSSVIVTLFGTHDILVPSCVVLIAFRTVATLSLTSSTQILLDAL